MTSSHTENISVMEVELRDISDALNKDKSGLETTGIKDKLTRFINAVTVYGEKYYSELTTKPPISLNCTTKNFVDLYKTKEGIACSVDTQNRKLSVLQSQVVRGDLEQDGLVDIVNSLGNSLKEFHKLTKHNEEIVKMELIEQRQKQQHRQQSSKPNYTLIAIIAVIIILIILLVVFYFYYYAAEGETFIFDEPSF